MPKPPSSSVPTPTEIADHMSRLTELRVAAAARLTTATDEYGAMDYDGGDVGAGEDEGGGEADVTSAERDRLKAAIATETQAIQTIDLAIERAKTEDWTLCVTCGGAIGSARLEAIPSTDRCVNCKAASNSW